MSIIERTALYSCLVVIVLLLVQGAGQNQKLNQQEYDLHTNLLLTDTLSKQTLALAQATAKLGELIKSTSNVYVVGASYK